MPSKGVPIVTREGDTLRIYVPSISRTTLRTRKLKARRLEAGLCIDCGRKKTIPKRRTTPLTHHCAGCMRKHAAADRRYRQRLRSSAMRRRLDPDNHDG